jgi:transcriptional regulator with XRE-family HTH domain
MVKDYLKAAFRASGLVRKEISSISGVKKSAIDEWVGTRGKEPRAYDLYAVCKAVHITMEQAVDGEAGVEYVRQVVRPELPSRIADIVVGLVELDEAQLDIIRGAMRPMLEAKKGKEMEATEADGPAG